MSGKRKKKRVEKKHAKTSLPKIETTPEFEGWVIFSFALLMLISVIGLSYGKGAGHPLGLVGEILGWIQFASFGIGSYFLAFYIGWYGLRRALEKTINHPFLKHLSIAVFIISFCMLASVLQDSFPRFYEWAGNIFYPKPWSQKIRFNLGGAPFFYIYKDLSGINLHTIFNSIGVTLIFGTTLIGSLLLLTKTHPSKIFYWLTERLSTIDLTVKNKETKDRTPILPAENIKRFVKLRVPNFSMGTKHHEGEPGSEMLAIQPELNLKTRPSLSQKEIVDDGPAESSRPFEGVNAKTKPRLEEAKPIAGVVKKELKDKREAALSAQRVYNGDFTEYKIPAHTLLTSPKNVDQTLLKKDLRKQAEVLEETLLSFGIEAKVGQINCGPTITSFEVHPAIGVKVQKIKALENDIALNMEAKSIRILAPIPGKAAIGIEVPNPQPQEVAFKEMLQSYQSRGKKFEIPVLLGKTVNGEYVMEDLAKMPHAIIAGATGSGKSVCINTIVMSILMNSKPDEIKLIMVDPKKVELTPYTRLPHMLAPVITEPKGACAAMHWLVKEMENRYEILKIAGFRNITSFNSRTINQEFEDALDKEIPKKMHYIVCIIDELADLMMVSSNEIETYIARIAQMARAVGIHLILATQRPSREVITGLIKANFPTRISFKVSSRINSQIILDEVGAEMLLGNGDMLFLPPGAHHLVRAQGAYIRDQDINAVVESSCNQSPPNYVIQSFDDMEGILSDRSAMDEDLPKDTLFDQALETVLSTGNASTTFLQRKLKVGYARAASIIDQLEAEGIIGPADGAKPRKILVKQDMAEEELF